MRSITTIIKNNRIDSFISSVNAALESAELTCIQDGNLTNMTNNLKENDVIVTPGTNSFTVKATGEFAGLSYNDILGRNSKLKLTDDKYSNAKITSSMTDEQKKSANTEKEVEMVISYTCPAE